MMVWDRLRCYEENRDRSVKFLSLTMQYADAFGYLIRVLAQVEPELKEYRGREGHLLLRTVLPHIARPKQGRSCLSKKAADKTGSKSALSREEYKK